MYDNIFGAFIIVYVIIWIEIWNDVFHHIFRYFFILFNNSYDGLKILFDLLCRFFLSSYFDLFSSSNNLNIWICILN